MLYKLLSKNCLPQLGLYIVVFFNQNIFDPSLPSTTQNYKAFFNELKLRRTTPIRKGEESSINLRFQNPPKTRTSILVKARLGPGQSMSMCRWHP